MRKYSNGRLVHRSGGRFAKSPSLGQTGFDVNDQIRTCTGCGHQWWPVVVTGTCPACGKERAAITETPQPTGDESC